MDRKPYLEPGDRYAIGFVENRGIGGLDMVNRTRNDNVSGRVPLSAGRATDPAVEAGIALLGRHVREGKWNEAQELLARIKAGEGAEPPRCRECGAALLDDDDSCESACVSRNARRRAKP